jgi:hypothetical protein
MGYMVMVAGRGEPKHEHPTLEAAVVEAERLAALPDTRGRSIYILQVIDELRPVSSHQWMSGVRGGEVGS